MLTLNLTIQTLITRNNKESDKLQNLNVLHYYNDFGDGGYKFTNGDDK